MRLEFAVDIAAPPDAVFGMLADIPSWPRYIAAIERIDLLTPGLIGIGTRFRETRRRKHRWVSEEMLIEAFERPRHMRLVAVNHGARYVITHSVEPRAIGARLALLFESMPMTRFSRIFSFVGGIRRGSLEELISADLASLKTALESPHSSITEER